MCLVAGACRKRVAASKQHNRNCHNSSFLALQRWDSALSSPVFGCTEAAYTSVINQTPRLLARTLSLPFAGNFAGIPTIAGSSPVGSGIFVLH